jgi:galactose-1-phosphate uridylyltransferase
LQKSKQVSNNVVIKFNQAVPSVFRPRHLMLRLFFSTLLILMTKMGYFSHRTTICPELHVSFFSLKSELKYFEVNEILMGILLYYQICMHAGMYIILFHTCLQFHFRSTAKWRTLNISQLALSDTTHWEGVQKAFNE